MGSGHSASIEVPGILAPTREDKGGVKKMKEMMSWRRTWVPMGLFGAAEEETRGRRGGKREKKTEREKMLLSRSNK